MPAWLVYVLCTLVAVAGIAFTVITVKAYEVPTWLKWVLGFLGLLIVVGAILTIVATTKEMGLVEYIGTWFEKAAETAPEVEETVATMIARK